MRGIKPFVRSAFIGVLTHHRFFGSFRHTIRRWDTMRCKIGTTFSTTSSGVIPISFAEGKGSSSSTALLANKKSRKSPISLLSILWNVIRVRNGVERRHYLFRKVSKSWVDVEWQRGTHYNGGGI